MKCSARLYGNWSTALLYRMDLVNTRRVTEIGQAEHKVVAVIAKSVTVPSQKPER